MQRARSPACSFGSRSSILRLVVLLPGVSAKWWEPSPPPPYALGSVCPSGAEFKYAQVWPSGFRAVVTVGKWVTGRKPHSFKLARAALRATVAADHGQRPLVGRVVLHFDGEAPVFSRPVGAELLTTSGTSVTFSLSGTPGHLAKDSFDLQARGKPPDVATVHVSCELAFPPPPPAPSAPPALVETCSPYSPQLQVRHHTAGHWQKLTNLDRRRLLFAPTAYLQPNLFPHRCSTLGKVDTAFRSR